MADISISQLPSATDLSSSDLIDIVQGAGNRKATLDMAANYFNEQNIIVSDTAPPTSCTSGDLENYNKGKIYIYKTQSSQQGYILEEITETQSGSGVWELTWYTIGSGGGVPGEYVTPAQLEAHNTSPTAHEDIRETINVILHNINISSFADVQDIVRQGFASKAFQVGEQFIINESTGLSATIIGFDYDTPTDSEFTHSMTLQMTDLIYPKIAFSSPQAAWYIDGNVFPNGLEAGTYYFYLSSDYPTQYGGSKNYKFTLTKTVPVGGVVCIKLNNSFVSQFSTGIVSTYASQNTTTALESGITLTEGNNGTELPSLKLTPDNNYTNSINRIVGGSCSWKDSYIRSYLNSSGSNWWSPKTTLDYKPSSVPTGYLSTFSGTNFLSVVGTVYKKTQKSAIDGYGVDITSDKFFLLSRPEVYGGLEKSQEDIPNIAYEYYGPGRSSLNHPGTGADTNRIKYTNNIALTYGLRTPVATENYQVRTVSTNGSISQTNGADAYLRFAPACVIY